ncbi:type VI secretion system lipoprotein TssJ [Methylobacterium aerolatum]|uniref:Type VI secretion system protein VasD n=1 Tax=Methylobacterium aerolatum TaxID=418708 RepID=A0ABU0HYR8_9HYPH|nr:type VI secretion system lipoprotein TssJ [Methylobacterium aerolatum]MDQ0446953.1 type VI secretion system protein VasD [Methylobacterium aerolatum]
MPSILLLRREVRRRQLCGWLAAGLGAPLVSACALGPPAEKTNSLEITLDADEGINPNERNEPAPVVVRLYELRATSTFEQASFFDLLDNDTAKLGADLVAKREYELKPGEKKVITRDAPSAARYLGVIAGFRQITAAEWRASADIVPDRDNGFLIKIDATTVTLTRQRASFKFGIF